MTWKRALASLVPARTHKTAHDTQPQHDSLDDLFEHVYRTRLWGAPSLWQRWRSRFYSGPGSHDRAIVKPYIDGVREFVRSRPPLNAVDLGCGDFNVGRQLRSAFRNYIACDIVSDLIRRNRRVFDGMNVDFRCLNIVNDPLPSGEIAFLRQVLQHLSNDQIARIVGKLEAYRFLVITEHLPDKSIFTPNLDHESGSGLRLGRDSGVVLTSAPFNLPVKSHTQLCSIRQLGGVVRTDVYELC